jgi:hypothetical protein
MEIEIKDKDFKLRNYNDGLGLLKVLGLKLRTKDEVGAFKKAFPGEYTKNVIDFKEQTATAALKTVRDLYAKVVPSMVYGKEGAKLAPVRGRKFSGNLERIIKQNNFGDLLLDVIVAPYLERKLRDTNGDISEVSRASRSLTGEYPGLSRMVNLPTNSLESEEDIFTKATGLYPAVASKE